MSFRIVPRGTPGAIPLKEAMEIRLKELKIHVCSDELRSHLRMRTRESWERGVYGEVPSKISATHLRNHGQTARGKRR